MLSEFSVIRRHISTPISYLVAFISVLLLGCSGFAANPLAQNIRFVEPRKTEWASINDAWRDLYFIMPPGIPLPFDVEQRKWRVHPLEPIMRQRLGDWRYDCLRFWPRGVFQENSAGVQLKDMRLGQNVWGTNQLTIFISNTNPAPVQLKAEVIISDTHERVKYRHTKVFQAEAGEPKGQPRLTTIIMPYQNQIQAEWLAARVKILDMNDKCLAHTQYGFALPYCIRLYLARCRYFEDETIAKATLSIPVDQETLRRVTVKLELKQGDKVLAQETLRNPETSVCYFDVPIEKLGPGNYELLALLIDDKGQTLGRSLQQFEKVSSQITKRKTVPILFDEVPRHSRRLFPAKGGIPIPDGELEKAEHVRLLDENHAEIPCQVRPLSYWAENQRFIKWLLLDTQINTVSGQAPARFLEYGTQVARQAVVRPIKVTANDSGIEVDTGVLKFQVSRAPFSFLEQVWLDQDGTGNYSANETILSEPAEAVLELIPRNAEKTASAMEKLHVGRFSTGADSNSLVTVEESGPLRATVRAEGWYTGVDRQACKYILRISAFRGLPLLKLEHTFIFTEEPAKIAVKKIAVRLKLRAGDTCTFGGEQGSEQIFTTQLAKEAACYALQEQSAQFKIQGAGLNVAGKKLQGWVDLCSSKKIGTTAFLRDIWQQFPGALEAKGEGLISVEPVPQQIDLGNTLTENEEDEQCNAIGVAKTHEIFLLFHGPEWTPETPRNLTTSFQHPIMPTAPPDWTCASETAGLLHPYDPRRFSEEEQALDNLMAGIQLQRLAYEDMLGIFNYGDTHNLWDDKRKEWDKAKRYHTNNETTGDCTTYSVWMQYLRTMKRTTFEWCEARTRHLMDVDTCNYSRNVPDRIPLWYTGPNQNIPGMQHKHGRDHWSCYTEPHHTLYDDIVLYYQLSGSMRAMDVMQLGRDTLLHARLPKNYAVNAEARPAAIPARMSLDLYLQFFDEDLLNFNRLCWENIFIGYGPTYNIATHDKYYRLTHDRRFLQAYFLDCLDERDPPKEDLVTLAMRRPIGWYPPSMWAHQTAVFYSWIRAPELLAPVVASSNWPDAWHYINNLTLKRFPDTNTNGGGRGFGWNLGTTGYPWNSWEWFKYAYLMRAIIESNIEAEKTLQQKFVQTNGTGGGKWRDAKTWKNSCLPKADEAILVASGDVLIFDGQATEPLCTGMTISENAKFLFADGEHALVVRGNVIVEKNGLLKMNPGSTLRIYSRPDLYNGVIVRGRLEAQGASHRKPNCIIAALERFPHCEMLLRFEGGSHDAGWLRFCTLRGVNIEVQDTYLPVVTGNSFEKCSITYSVSYVSRNQPAVVAQQFTANDLAGSTLTMTHVHDFTVSENRFHDGEWAISYEGSEIKDQPNRFINNQIYNCLALRGSAVKILSYYGSLHPLMSGNVYYHNIPAALKLGTYSKEVPVELENEIFYGNVVGVLTDGGVKMRNCIFGRNTEGIDDPNFNADIQLNADADKGVILDNCILASSTPVNREAQAKRPWVQSVNHNRIKGLTNTWGTIPAELPRSDDLIIKDVK